MFEPQDTGESYVMGITIIALTTLSLMVLWFQTQRIIKVIEQTPKETVELIDNYIKTEKNP